MYETILITVGSIAAVIALVIFRKAPLHVSTERWLRTQPFPTSMIGMYALIAAISLPSIALTSTIFSPGLSSITELLVVFAWTALLTALGYFTVLGARYHYGESRRKPRASARG